MKVVVPVKQVAALDDEFELLEDGSGVDPDRIEWDLNEWDTFSLEAAVQLRDSVGDGEVVAVTVGDEEAGEGLLTALAKGPTAPFGSGTRRSPRPIRSRSRGCWRRQSRPSPPISCSAACNPRMPSTAPPGLPSRAIWTFPTSRS